MQTVMQNTTTSGKTSTIITIEIDKLCTSRVISNKIMKLDIELLGTVKDMLEKVRKVNLLTDSIYCTLAEASQSTLDSFEAGD